MHRPLLWPPHNPQDDESDSKPFGPGITDETLEIIMIDWSNINPKDFAQYEYKLRHCKCTRDELTLSDFDLVEEQLKEPELI